jgi:hypothetical protein
LSIPSQRSTRHGAPGRVGIVAVARARSAEVGVRHAEARNLGARAKAVRVAVRVEQAAAFGIRLVDVAVAVVVDAVAQLEREWVCARMRVVAVAAHPHGEERVRRTEAGARSGGTEAVAVLILEIVDATGEPLALVGRPVAIVVFSVAALGSWNARPCVLGRLVRPAIRVPFRFVSTGTGEEHDARGQHREEQDARVHEGTIIHRIMSGCNANLVRFQPSSTEPLPYESTPSAAPSAPVDCAHDDCVRA